MCGISIAALTPAAAVQHIVERTAASDYLQAHLCNAYTLSLVDSDPRLREALIAADLNLPDGAPVAWLGRRAGTHGPVRGPGLVGDVMRAGVPFGIRHYLYGGTPEVVLAMADRLRAEIPGVQIVAADSPPFRDLDPTDLADAKSRIVSSRAGIVWVGLGTPRQDYFVPLLAEQVDATVIPVGAAFDFWAGEVKQAPAALHGSGFEWVYRLAAEPRRLWKRYLIGNPRFVSSALSHRRDLVKPQS
ncbi:MAG: WecB/TagA/CpsF family glycosyltransferase [Sporichthyaceae bacterium]